MQTLLIHKRVGVRLLLALFATATVTSLVSVLHAAPAFADTLKGTWVVQSGNKVLQVTGPTSGTGFSVSGTYVKLTIKNNTMVLGGTTDPTDGSCGVYNITVQNYQNATSGVGHQYSGLGDCEALSTDTVNFTNYYSDPSKSTGNNPAPSSSSGDGCPIDQSDGLRWVLCPLFITGSKTVGLLNGLIQNFLFVPTDQIFGTAANANKGTSSFQEAFNTFRNIGLGLLVIAGLVMVFSQAAGLDIFSAHTVRKALPRIVLAAIGMALAWPILLFVITFFNDIGSWVGQIILTAAHVQTGSDANITASGLANVATVVLGLLAAGAVYGTAGVMSIVGTILLALFIGFVVLAIRQLVILLCVLLAPLAIASSVLPGTEKLWKFWRDTLIGALVMFPIIMGFLTAGAAMASIAAAAGTAAAANGDNIGNISWDLMAMLIYFAPYFLLPFSFRLASGLMGNIFGLVNDRNKGLFDRLSKFRQGRAAENLQNTLAGQRFQGNNPLTGLLNKPGGELGAFLGSKNKLGYFRKGVRQSAREQNRAIAAARFAKLESTAAGQFNDPMLQAQTYNSATEARANMARDFGVDADVVEQAIRDVQVSGGFGGARARYAAMQLAATGTGYANMAQELRTVARVTGGNESEIASMVGNMRSLSERAGRNDQKAGYNTMRKLTVAIAHNNNSTDGLEYQVEDAQIEAARGTDNPTLWRNKTPSVTNMTAALTKGLDRYLDWASNPNHIPDDVAQKAGGRAAAALAAKEMAAAIKDKIGNMRAAAEFGYGPELNVEASSNVALGQPVQLPGQQITAPVVTPGQVRTNMEYIRSQIGNRPVDKSTPPNYNNVGAADPNVARVAHEQDFNRGGYDPRLMGPPGSGAAPGPGPGAAGPTNP